MLESIRFIDEVVFFETDFELDALILSSGAETMVIGSDYKNKKVIGSRHVQTVKFFDRIGKHSTTRIIEGLH